MFFKIVSRSVRISFPKICALPEVGEISPVRVRMVVDFPAPLGPIKPKNSPSLTDRFSASIPLDVP